MCNSSGSCVACPGTAVCDTACASWDFESGVAAPWAPVLDILETSANGANAAIVSTNIAAAGTHSLRIPYTIYGGGVAEVGAMLCSSGTAPLGNYYMSFDFYSDTYSGWVVGMAWGPSEWASNPMLYSNTGQWQHYDMMFGTAVDANYVGISMSVDSSTVTLSGTAYIDNIVMTH
jgi:hypothetical protein